MNVSLHMFKSLMRKISLYAQIWRVATTAATVFSHFSMLSHGNQETIILYKKYRRFEIIGFVSPLHFVKKQTPHPNLRSLSPKKISYVFSTVSLPAYHSFSLDKKHCLWLFARKDHKMWNLGSKWYGTRFANAMPSYHI